jgi:hypothetical protein
MSSVTLGVHRSGKLMEGDTNLLGVIKWLKVPFDIVNSQKRENGVSPEQNVDYLLAVIVTRWRTSV